MSSPQSSDPTLASARPDPRAGTLKMNPAAREALQEMWDLARAGDLPAWVDAGERFGAAVVELCEAASDRRLRAAEAERDAVKAAAQKVADLDALLHGPITKASLDITRESWNMALADLTAALARASQGDPATGTRSVPRPTEEERG